MEVLFDESDLEPWLGSPASKGSETTGRDGPKAGGSPAPSEATLDLGLEEPLWRTPATVERGASPVRSVGVRATLKPMPRERFGRGALSAKAVPDRPEQPLPFDPFDESDPFSEPFPEADSDMAPDEEMREDGLVRIVNRDTCKDPEVLRERRTSGGTSGKTRVRTAFRERPSLKARAVAALARRDHSRRELAAKLGRTLGEDETAEMLDAVLDDLERLGYLSDERFAKVRARSRSTQLGDARIRQELRRNGVSSELVREAIDGLEESEEIRAYRVWKKRFREIPKDYRERERQTRYLAYRGFGMGVIARVLRGRVEDPDAQD